MSLLDFFFFSLSFSFTQDLYENLQCCRYGYPVKIKFYYYYCYLTHMSRDDHAVQLIEFERAMAA